MGELTRILSSDCKYVNLLGKFGREAVGVRSENRAAQKEKPLTNQRFFGMVGGDGGHLHLHHPFR
jgi:hypothetical protein